jgi:hypothetical protein
MLVYTRSGDVMVVRRTAGENVNQNIKPLATAVAGKSRNSV